MVEEMRPLSAPTVTLKDVKVERLHAVYAPSLVSSLSVQTDLFHFARAFFMYH